MELIFSLSLVIIVYKIVSVDSSVNAALFLILLAIVFSMFLFYFNVNFLAILYLAVYIGAVAVFFLFVVMMTDLNSDEFKEKPVSLNLFILSIFLGLLFSSLIVFLIFNFFNVNNLNIDIFSSNIEIIGASLFGEHSGPFILVSLIILVALIGSIFITFNSDNIGGGLNFNNRSQDMEVQLSRSVLTSVNF